MSGMRMLIEHPNYSAGESLIPRGMIDSLCNHIAVIMPEKAGQTCHSLSGKLSVCGRDAQRLGCSGLTPHTLGQSEHLAGSS